MFSKYKKILKWLRRKVKLKNGKIGYMCEDYIENSNGYALKKGSRKKLNYKVDGNEQPSFMVQARAKAGMSFQGWFSGHLRAGHF